MIVVDTNVIAYLHLDSEQRIVVDSVFAADPNWVAPYLWRSEFRNVLSQYVRKNLLSLMDASEIMDSAHRIMDGGEYDVSSERVLALAQSSGCSAYDCEFVALAHHLGIPLVTVDQQLLLNFPEIALSPAEFLTRGGKQDA